MLKMLISPWVALIALVIVVIAATIAFIFVKHNMKEEDYIEILNRLEDMAHTSDSIFRALIIPTKNTITLLRKENSKKKKRDWPERKSLKKA